MKRRLLLAVLVALFALALTACSGGGTASNDAVYDDGKVSFEITGNGMADDGSYVINATATNNSDETVTFSVEAASLDGVTCDSYYLDELSPGTSAQETISWTADELAALNIPEPKGATLLLNIYDDEFESLFQDFVVVGSLATTERDPQEGDVTIMDGEDITVTMTKITSDSEGTALDLYIYNDSDKYVWINAESVTVNDQDVDPFWAVSVMPHSGKYSCMSWTDAAETTIIDKIEFVWQVSDNLDYLGGFLYEGTFTWEPEEAISRAE